MKLTNKQLRQIIKEELEKLFEEEKSYVRSVADESKPVKNPKHAAKLSRLAKDDYNLARELADTLDEPLDTEVDSKNMKTIPAKKYSMEQFDADEMFTNFLGYINREFRLNKKETDPIDPKHVKAFANETKQNPKEVLKKLKQARSQYVKVTGKFDAYDHMRKQGYDVENYFGIGKNKWN